MTFEAAYAVVSDINDKYRYYKSTESLYELDQWSGLPAAGGAYRQKMAAFIAGQKAGLFKTPEAAAAYDYFSKADLSRIDDYVMRGKVRVFRNLFSNNTKAPAELVNRYNLLRADTMQAWKAAREAKDFKVFEPWLEQVFALKKEIALAIAPGQSAFDTLVGITDEGLNAEEVAREFEVLKPGIMGLMKKIAASGQRSDLAILDHEEDPEELAAFGRRLAAEVGFDPARGSVNHKVVHGFCSFMGPRDARISTPIHGKPHLLFTCLHENGHQMYSCSSSDRVCEENMWGGIEGSFHEANARFYENIIGKSRAYWDHYYPILQEAFPGYRSISQEAFFRAVNDVHPSLKRIEADEVSYSLHAILRFELERDYFEGHLKVHDMAEAWNQKYEDYLGIRPANDLEGVLQDMHWAGDYIGYFQSYALGNIYDGQILQAVQKAIPDLYTDVAKGRFERLNAWMYENIWQYGCCFTAAELMQKLSGKALDAAPFVQYLNEKYTALYGLS